MRNDDPVVVVFFGTAAIIVVLITLELFKAVDLSMWEATIALGVMFGVIVAFLPVVLLLAYVLDRLFEWLGWFAEEREAR